MSEQPIPETRPACAGTGAGRSEVPYLALHPMGFSVPPRLRLERWALTPPFHPYRRTSRPGGGLSFCGTVRRDASRRRRPRVSQSNRPELRGIAPCGVRTFLPRSRRERFSALPKPASPYGIGARQARPRMRREYVTGSKLKTGGRYRATLQPSTWNLQPAANPPPPCPCPACSTTPGRNSGR